MTGSTASSSTTSTCTPLKTGAAVPATTAGPPARADGTRRGPGGSPPGRHSGPGGRPPGPNTALAGAPQRAGLGGRRAPERARRRRVLLLSGLGLRRRVLPSDDGELAGCGRRAHLLGQLLRGGR